MAATLPVLNWTSNESIATTITIKTTITPVLSKKRFN